ncbi:MAG TPA: A/G-specific adenine glycosylase [Pseudomonadales bacterium]
MPLAPAAFQKRVLHWFDQCGRHDLPWQHDITPYRVWLSEIMLQQTQVATVIPYYKRFLKTFPTIKKLASAPIDEVMHLWTGLGYYSRARNLHRCAHIICTDHGGQFPDTVDALAALPGIGRSTAGAIVSIAFGQRAAILDGNVKRVLARYCAIDGWPGDAATARQLWSIAERYTPKARCGDYSQAMMDLGATVCTRTKPDCAHCPLTKTCAAYAAGTPTAWPHSKARKAMPHKHWQLLVLQHTDGSVLLEQRPSSGIWGGLWCLPISETAEAPAMARAICGSKKIGAQSLPPITHAFSHFRVTLEPVLIRLRKPVILSDTQRWYNSAQRIGLPGPIKPLLHSIIDEELP